MITAYAMGRIKTLTYLMTARDALLNIKPLLVSDRIDSKRLDALVLELEELANSVL